MTIKINTAKGALFLALVLYPLGSQAGEFAPDPEYISDQMMPFFKGKTPAQIAPYLAHHSSNPYHAAAKALAAHGQQALPLIEKLLGDSNPWLRAGATHTLGIMFRDDEPDRKTPRKVTPEYLRAVALAATMLNDDHPAVQEALGGFVQAVQVDTPETRKMALFMAASTDPAVRGQANNMARRLFKDPATVIKICTIVGAARDGNTPDHWNIAYLMLKEHKNNPLVREAFPSYAWFLCHLANSRPYRGFFSDGAQNHMMEVLQVQWDDTTETVPDLVPGLCRSYVRVPYHPYPGWVKTRKLAIELLGRGTAKSAPVILATCAEEKQWLAEVDDVTFSTTVEFRTPLAEAKAQGRQYISDLEALAAKLANK